MRSQLAKIERMQLQGLCEEVVGEFDLASKQVSALLRIHAYQVMTAT